MKENLNDKKKKKDYLFELPLWKFILTRWYFWGFILIIPTSTYASWFEEGGYFGLFLSSLGYLLGIYLIFVIIFSIIKVVKKKKNKK